MKKEYGLVLTGGGSKGAYEVGAYKALKEMNINITAIVGTSIGAINGAMMIQYDFDEIHDFYKNIQIKNLMDLDTEIDESKNIFYIKNLVKLVKDYTRKKGFSNEPLKKMLVDNLDLDKIYNSDIDYGVMTYSKKSKEPVEIFKNDVTKEELIEYILASACFPIYKAQKIKDDELIDGGFYDNMPINMLAKKGYKNIIVLDVNGIGFFKNVEKRDLYVKMIRTSEYLGGTFELNKDLIEKNIKLGYLDTLKAFNKLQGHIFYFSTKEFFKLLRKFTLDEIYGLETAARIYKMDKYKIYTAKEFLNELKEKHEKASKKYEKIRANQNKIIFKEIKNLMEIVNKGLGVCFFEELIEKNPKERDGIYKLMFSEYISAAIGMIELANMDELDYE